MEILESKQSELEKKSVQLLEDAFNEFKLKNQDDFFFLALPGGNSIVNILELLAESIIDWCRVKILLTDERDVDIDDTESNMKLLNDLLISKIKIPTENILKPTVGFEPERIDFIILSSGEDGHIASLFPNHNSILNTDTGYIKIQNSPKPPETRFSLSKNTILKSKNTILLFFGLSKFDAFQNFNNPLLSEKECPAKLLEESNNLTVLADVVK